MTFRKVTAKDTQDLTSKLATLSKQKATLSGSDVQKQKRETVAAKKAAKTQAPVVDSLKKAMEKKVEPPVEEEPPPPPPAAAPAAPRKAGKRKARTPSPRIAEPEAELLALMEEAG